MAVGTKRNAGEMTFCAPGDAGTNGSLEKNLWELSLEHFMGADLFMSYKFIDAAFHVQFEFTLDLVID